MADSKISDLAAVSDLLTSDEYVLARAGASKKITGANLKTGVLGPGALELVYRYQVAGSDKATIDTGVDTPDAGTNDWTNGDLLEVYFSARSDQAVVIGVFNLTVNNDTSSIYDSQLVQASGSTTVAGAAVAGAANWAQGLVHAANSGSGYPGSCNIILPNYANTVLWKVGEMDSGGVDTSIANDFSRKVSLGYRSTSAITRMKFDATSTFKFKVGSLLLIYKRKTA